MDDAWGTIEQIVNWLDKSRTLPAETEKLLRIMKLTEEAGEVTQAVIGTLGQNPRKGITHTWDDVQAELRASGLERAEDQLDRAVHFSGLGGVEAACEVSEAAGVDGSHLVDEHEGPGAVHLYLGAEDRGLGAGGRRGDDERGEYDSVALDRDCVPRAALLVA